MRGTWTKVRIALDQSSLATLQSETEPYGALFEFVATLPVQVGRHQIPIRPVQYRLMQMRLADVTQGEGGTDDVIVTLRPGENSRFELRLLERGGSIVTDAAAHVEGNLDPYAGRWIAQAGAEVIVSGDSPAEVLAALKETGRRGAIWRVPASKDEADGIILGL